MKRAIILAAMALAAHSAVAAACVPAENYRVGRIAYRMRTAGETLGHILRGTPYQGVFEAKAEAQVKAKRLAGPLSRSLDALAEQTGTRWRQEGCQIRFSDRTASTASPAQGNASAAKPDPGAKPAAAVWTLKADEPIHLQFAEWARQAGWHFEWRLERSWRVPAATQFTGSFDQALSEAVEGLYAQGKPVRLILWEGNRFAEIVDVDAK